MKKGLIIAAAVLMAAGLLLCTVALLAAGFDMSKLDTAKYVTNTYVPGEDFRQIEINTKEGDILVKPSEDGRCIVTCLEREKVKHRVTVEDGVLKIAAEDQREWYDHLNFFSKDLSLTVYLPRDRYEALTVKGSTGDVDIPAPFTFGRIDVSVSTGDVTCGASTEGLLQIKGSTGYVRLEEVSAGEADIFLSTGDILGQSIRCGTVNLKVSSGEIKLTDLKCLNLYAKGSTGDINLKKIIATEMLQIKTETGDVAFDDCNAWQMEVSASTGDVTFDACDAGQIEVTTSTGDVTGTLRTEKVFIARTSTGSVRVPDTAAGGVCRITTSTGDIEIGIKQ